MRLTATAHALLAAEILPGDVVIDATAGNGHDSVFLAQCVGVTGHVYCFDIQTQALTTTAQQLNAHNIAIGKQATLINACHSRLSDYVPTTHHGKIACAMFNLGYLPGGEHHITTTGETTVTAIRHALQLLRPGGVISVLGYTGHAGGQEEVNAIVLSFIDAVPDIADWQEIVAAREGAVSGPADAPRLFVGRRRE